MSNAALSIAPQICPTCSEGTVPSHLTQCESCSLCLHCEAYGLDIGSTVCVECGKDESDPLCAACKDTGFVRRSGAPYTFEVEERCDCGIQPETADSVRRTRFGIAVVL